MIENSKQSEESLKPRASRIGFDNLLEDVFGLNIRSFKTIWITFSKPQDYFQAADDPNWLDRYTPSFRVWFGLLAIYTFLRFIYGSDDGIMIEMYVGIFTEIAASPTYAEFKIDPLNAAQETLKWMFVFYPFALTPFYLLVAWLFRSYPAQTSTVQRIRYVFATVLPSTLLVLLSTFLFLMPITASGFAIISVATVGMMVLTDWITAYRGPFAKTDKKNRVGLSLVFTILLFVSYVCASVIAVFPAISIAVASSIERVEIPADETLSDSANIALKPES